MALAPWRTGIVIKIEQQAEHSCRFFIRVPELTVFDFKPGQFVTLDLPIHEKPHKRLRSYSISSWPDGTNVFELCIVLLPEGSGTNYLFNEVKIGSEIKFRGPAGVFTLPEHIDKDIFLICTGTGVAPFRSMLHHIINHNIPHKEIYLLFGTRKKINLLYYDELQALAAKYPEIHYIPVLSREEWDGKMGYVHEVYQEIINKKKETLRTLPETSFFLCGWKNMIDEAKHHIQELGYEKKMIHQELYG